MKDWDLVLFTGTGGGGGMGLAWLASGDWARKGNCS